jgi:hypothetical protein
MVRSVLSCVPESKICRLVVVVVVVDARLSKSAPSSSWKVSGNANVFVAVSAPSSSDVVKPASYNSCTVNPLLKSSAADMPASSFNSVMISIRDFSGALTLIWTALRVVVVVKVDVGVAVVVVVVVEESVVVVVVNVIVIVVFVLVVVVSSPHVVDRCEADG